MERTEKNNPLSGDWGYAGTFDCYPPRMGMRVPGGGRRHEIPKAGDRFGKNTVFAFEVGPRGGLRGIWCRCDCGAESLVDPHALRRGHSQGCDRCAKKAAAETRKKYWGYADLCPDDDKRALLLNRISAIYGRCYNPKNPAYPHYGGRGIRVSFADRRAFLAHLLTLPNCDDLTRDIDRIDTDGDYAPGNLRFATKRENVRNRRRIGELQSRVDMLEAENTELRERLRRLERGAAA